MKYPTDVVYHGWNIRRLKYIIVEVHQGWYIYHNWSIPRMRYTTEWYTTDEIYHAWSANIFKWVKIFKHILLKWKNFLLFFVRILIHLASSLYGITQYPISQFGFCRWRPMPLILQRVVFHLSSSSSKERNYHWYLCTNVLYY